jgi:hypothetical protein
MPVATKNEIGVEFETLIAAGVSRKAANDFMISKLDAAVPS